MNDAWIVYGLVSCMGINRISLDLIASKCHILKDEAREIIKRAKKKEYLFCNKDLEDEILLVVSSNITEFDLDKVCVINANMKLDGSGFKND